MELDRANIRLKKLQMRSSESCGGPAQPPRQRDEAAPAKAAHLEASGGSRCAEERWCPGPPASWECPQVLDELRANQQLCDGLIRCADGKHFKVHRVLLSAVSPYFRALFTNSINGGSPENSEVTLDEASGSAIHQILDFVYTGWCAVTVDNVESLLPLADRLDVQGVVQQCCQFLLRHMQPENCLGIFRLAQQYSCRGLEDSCRRYILHHFRRVVSDSPELGELPVRDLIALLSDDELNVRSEELVFEAVHLWVDQDPVGRRHNLPALLACVRFGLASHEFFVNGVLAYEHIANDQSLQLEGQELLQCLMPIADFLANVPSADPDIRHPMLRPRVPYEVLFAVGGWKRSTTNLIETYDCRADRWCLSAHVDSQPRAYHGLVALDGLIYMIGGLDGDRRFNTVRCFDPVSHEWRERACMYEARCYVSTCTLGGEIYTMGGCDNAERRLNSVEVYNPATNQWRQITPMLKARSDASAATLNGKIYVVGGFNGIHVLSSAEVFDPGTQRWSLIEDMISPRSGVSLVALRGCLYALGGFDGSVRLKSGERYDPTAAEWEPIKDMLLRRSNFTSVVLDDHIFVIGGFNGRTIIANTEYLDVDTNDWYAVRSMNVNRSALAAVVLAGISSAEEYSYLHVIRQEHLVEGQ